MSIPYGLDLKDGTDFSKLVAAVDDIDGIERSGT